MSTCSQMDIPPSGLTIFPVVQRPHSDGLDEVLEWNSIGPLTGSCRQSITRS